MCPKTGERMNNSYIHKTENDSAEGTTHTGSDVDESQKQ